MVNYLYSCLHFVVICHTNQQNFGLPVPWMLWNFDPLSNSFNLHSLCTHFPQPPISTPPETNIAPENRPSQKEIHLPTSDFQGRAVSFREGNEQLKKQNASPGIDQMMEKIHENSVIAKWIRTRGAKTDWVT